MALAATYTSLIPEILRFCADVHLGKPSRLLRMLGFDTAYKKVLSKEELYSIARNERRILLSRDSSFPGLSEIDSFFIKKPDSEIQVSEMIDRFDLRAYLNLFSWCLYCHEILEKPAKAAIEEFLLPSTKASFSEFRKCPPCKRVYWKGSHYERMSRLVEKLKNEPEGKKQDGIFSVNPFMSYLWLKLL